MFQEWLKSLNTQLESSEFYRMILSDEAELNLRDLSLRDYKYYLG